MKRRYLHKRNENGQALTEMLVGIIALLMLFIGFLLISSLGVDRIHNTISARENAEQRSLNGVNSQSGAPIRYWDYGTDELSFTSDDTPVNTMTDSTLFTSQLVGSITTHIGDMTDATMSAEDYIRSLQFSDLDNYRADLNSGTQSLRENFATDLGGNNLFVTAAGLSEGREVINDSLERRNLSGLKNAMQKFFGVSEFELVDTVYLPAQSPVNRGQ